MAVGYEKQNDPAQFEGELSDASLRDPEAGQRALEGHYKRAMAADEAGRLSNEERYAQTMNEEDNRQRQQTRLEQVKEKGKEMAADYATKYAKTAIKSWAKRAILLNPYFWMAVGFVVLIVGFILIAIMTTMIACNKPEDLAGGGWKGKLIVFAARTTSNMMTPGTLAFFEKEICSHMKIGAGTGSQVQPATQAAPPAGQGLVPITGVPTGTSLNAQLRPCMLAHVQLVYRQARIQGIDFIITSAYRPGAVVEGTTRPSAHARGEAVDVAIVPPPPSGMSRAELRAWLAVNPAFQRKVRVLRGLFESDGFISPQGDTLDEYNNPTEGATGGHIHVEYNIPANANNSYCTNPANYDL